MTNNADSYFNEIGRFNPTQAFQATLEDLVTLIDLKTADDSTLDDMEFLQLAAEASNRFKAISVMTVAALMQPAYEKVDRVTREVFNAQVEQKQREATPESTRAEMLQTLKNVAENMRFRPDA